jgi:hypothetical protein
MTSIQFRLICICLALTSAPIFAQETTKPPEIKPPAAVPPDTEPKIELPKPLSPEEIEAKRLADAAEEQRREQAKKEAEEAARRKAEAEKSFFTKLVENSKVYTGLVGGIGVGVNKLHGTGYTLGMSVDVISYKTWGFHFAAETGQYPAKSGTLSTGGVPVTISSGGSFGFLALDFAAVYAFPKVFNLEPAAGLGISIYQLRGGAYDFNQTVAPLLYGSLYYDLLSHLQVGFITQLTLPTASKLESAGASAMLDNSVGQTTVAFKLALRYAWF